MKPVLGAVTIGQSPRVDLVPELMEMLGGNVTIKEAGALDDLTSEQIQQLAPGPNDYVLVSRLRNGGSAKMAERLVSPLVKQAIKKLYDEGAQVIVLLCTGEFPPLQIPNGLLVIPQPLINGIGQALARDSKLGVIRPSSDQIPQATRAWQPACKELVLEAASPYVQGDGIALAANSLKDAEVDMIIMDCMGYTKAMQEQVRTITGKPVLLARSLVARILAELLNL